MPKNSSIKNVLVLGAGPIVIGQACEFDYAGVQACTALKEEGCRVILLNSNPATIMTDPDMADATYIEPIIPEVVEEILLKENPDSILPIVGGQTALNCVVKLYEQGILAKYPIKLLGVSYENIVKAEDRQAFRQAAQTAGVSLPRAMIANNLPEALEVAEKLGYPIIIRHSFNLGGSGSRIIRDQNEFSRLAQHVLNQFPANGLLIEESISGWKEFELEIMQDSRGNHIVVCSIENLDPMGIHTGDSITVAPAQTLTDKEYQAMRQAAFRVADEIGMTTGGCNVQFAVDPQDGRMVVIEINPRLSRSSALASKATGFPIAKVATKLALGYLLDEIKNTATGNAIPCSFEPTLDYVVTKIPRFNFEKFTGCSTQLSTEMKSIGEVMAFGRNFPESLQKAISSLEIESVGLGALEDKIIPIAELRKAMQKTHPQRIWFIAAAFRQRISVEEVYQYTKIDPWFLQHIEELVKTESQINGWASLNPKLVFELKQMGFSDARLAELTQVNEYDIRTYRYQQGIRPVFKRVDTCAGEFKSTTAYLYSSYDYQTEALPSDRKKMLIIGSGPNRIGQGLEFDYCCVHAAKAVRELGYEAIIVNCNPETVSTDYNICDRLYLEPLTLEYLLEIIAVEAPLAVLVQFGGQTALRLGIALEEAGIPLLNVTANGIDLAENRQRFKELLDQLKLKQPLNTTFSSKKEALEKARQIGFPLVLRPSYVLSGSQFALVNEERELQDYLEKNSHPIFPILMEQFLENALEVEIDAISDGEEVFIPEIIEQLDLAGIHSGDSVCILPSTRLSVEIQTALKEQTIKLIKATQLKGLINIQFAIQNNQIFILEMNPRASRSVPFLAKATGIPLVKIATKCLLGFALAEQALDPSRKLAYFAVKIPIFSFHKFPEKQYSLNMEMKSTGEVMGIAKTLKSAYLKAKISAGSYFYSAQVFENEDLTAYQADNNLICLQNIFK